MRKKELLRALALKVAPLLISWFIKAIFLTCKKRFSGAKSVPDEPTIFAFWHGELIFQPYVYNYFRDISKAVVMISDHFDGKIIANTMLYFGLGTIHGSSNRSASRVLIQAIKHIKEGYDLGITPDGPRGPRHEIADGIVAIAQKTGSKVVTFSMKAEKKWQINSWDKFEIPKPFSKIEFIISEPLDVSGLTMEEAKAKIQAEMNL